MAILRTPAGPRHLQFAPRRQAEAAVEAEERGLGQFAGEPSHAPRLGESGAHERPGEPRQAGDTGGIAHAHPRPQVDGRFTRGPPFPASRPGAPAVPDYRNLPPRDRASVEKETGVVGEVVLYETCDEIIRMVVTLLHA